MNPEQLRIELELTQQRLRDARVESMLARLELTMLAGRFARVVRENEELRAEIAR